MILTLANSQNVCFFSTHGLRELAMGCKGFFQFCELKLVDDMLNFPLEFHCCVGTYILFEIARTMSYELLVLH